MAEIHAFEVPCPNVLRRRAPVLRDGVASDRKKPGPVGKVERNAVMRELFEDGTPCPMLAEAFGLSLTRVWQICAGHLTRRERQRRRDHLSRELMMQRADQYLEMYELGFNIREICERVGFKPPVVCTALKSHPDYKPRRFAGHRDPLSIEVPAWVPEHHRDRYRDIASFSGEEAAAQCLRRLKAFEQASR